MKIKFVDSAFVARSVVCTALFGAVFLCPAHAHEASGGDVRIVSTIDSGGSVQSGGDVQITGFIGEPGTVSSGGNVIARPGMACMAISRAGSTA